MSKILLFLLLLFSAENRSNFLKVENPKSTLDSRKVKYNFDELSGTIPYKLYLIIKELKNLKNEDNNLFLNRLLLYGPPGNGKSTLAKSIAKDIDAEIIEVNAPSVVTRYQGSGAATINNSFFSAMKVHLETGKKVIIFIDEIDAIANSSNKDKRIENEAAVQTLWIHLDKIKKDTNFFVICATNKFKDLNPTLLDRFGDNIIEIPNPDKKMREEVIIFFNNKFSLKLNNYLINELIKKTNDLSIRAIEDILRTTKRIQAIDSIRSLEQIIFDTIKTHKDKPKFSEDDPSEKKESNWQKFNIMVGFASAAVGIPYTIYQWRKNADRLEGFKPIFYLSKIRLKRNANLSQVSVKPEFQSEFKAMLCDSFHLSIKEIINRLYNQFKENSLTLNRLIIHGPNGNGKHTLVREIAYEVNCNIINLELRNICEPVATNLIDQTFKNLVNENERTILSINVDETTKYHNLVSRIKELNDKSNIIIILISNRYEFLDPNLISNFHNIIEIKNPDYKTVKKLVPLYLEVNKLCDDIIQKYALELLSPFYFSDIMRFFTTNKFSKKDIFEFVKTIKSIANIEGKNKIDKKRMETILNTYIDRNKLEAKPKSDNFIRKLINFVPPTISNIISGICVNAAMKAIEYKFGKK